MESCKLQDGSQFSLSPKRPLFTCEFNENLVSSLQFIKSQKSDQNQFVYKDKLSGTLKIRNEFSPGWKAVFTFVNISGDTIEISNVVPLGQAEDHLYITASGPWSLARSKIFRPGVGQVGVVLPDNAWELGYSDIALDEDLSICALSRRSSFEQAQRKRWKTILYPGGSVSYDIYADVYQGIWQNGLRMMFQQRWLYDLQAFDNTLFERKDLKWIRHCYVMAMQFAWDHRFYDNGYQFADFLQEGERLFGGYDVFTIWATWPTLGVDQRNQWDLYGDLPGGLPKLNELAQYARSRGTRFFISYNPWDQSTREENPHSGMARLISKIDADGVVLDTRGSSSRELQQAADSVKAGVVMYSEGMAVPKDMPRIVAGRVHDAIYMPPPLNLNKFIKPEFAIFRVCQLNEGRLHREIAVSFFNGIGIEINTFGPGRPDWMEEDFLYLGKTTKLLRENTSAFTSRNWTPLLPTLKDSLWVNQWQTAEKTIYTVYSLVPEGFSGALFNAPPDTGFHYVNLWHHQEIKPAEIDGELFLPVTTRAFDRTWLGTRQEGAIDCIARFKKHLAVKLKEDSLFIKSEAGDQLKLWAGNPTYQKTPVTLDSGIHKLKLYDLFGRYEGKFIIQLFNENELIDERTVFIKPGTSRRISYIEKTAPASEAPAGMVEIPAGMFTYQVEKKDSFIQYPDFSEPRTIAMNSFFMDKYPVTNEDFFRFIQATNYRPADTLNFLKHWENGRYKKGAANYPVVNVSLEDANAYARWCGKRLPADIEWAYAAQGTDGRKWPWGAEFDSTRCNVRRDSLMQVDEFPSGESPFGVADLVGNVWQLTDDVYDNGSYYFIIMRGGSYYHPTSSWWYVKGGPQPLNQHQMLLRVSPGFERNATVGFRCVMDSD